MGDTSAMGVPRTEAVDQYRPSRQAEWSSVGRARELLLPPGQLFGDQRNMSSISSSNFVKLLNFAFAPDCDSSLLE